MTPEARIAAAIEVLDVWLAGQRADAALKAWGRAHRFAGSGDRAAIRDHVFDAIRCKRSFAALGGAETGRGLMIGALRAAGHDPQEVFGAGGHAPDALTEAEAAFSPAPMPRAVSLDLPDWLIVPLEESLGADLEGFGRTGQSRAPVFVRVNLQKTDRAGAQDILAAEGIETHPVNGVETALEVTTFPRRIAGSTALRKGLIELQDAHSQAVTLGLPPAKRVLDYCAGAGGKALSLAAQGAEVSAHDIAPERMADLPNRAARAGADVVILKTQNLHKMPPFDMVFCDAPCSGSGTWRRDPEEKWRFHDKALRDVLEAQVGVLEAAKSRVTPEGLLVYVTCSVLRAENEAQIAAFLTRNPGWRLIESRRWPMGPGGDGFFRATLAK